MTVETHRGFYMQGVMNLSEGQMESLAKLLGDCGTGNEISRVLNARGLEDKSNESTKWRRLYWIFTTNQAQYKTPVKTFDFIRSFLTPVRYIGRSDEFERIRCELNAILSFSGIEYGPDSQFIKSNTAKTLTESEGRLNTIKEKFHGRRLHPEVYKYCRSELMQDNYFHAVFEASKGLAQRIRDMSEIDKDGAALVDEVFSINTPILALNSLQTETEKSEHRGYAALLKGCFAAVRNPLAHEPKILWSGGDDAADYLSLISLLHRKLDDCVKTGLNKVTR